MPKVHNILHDTYPCIIHHPYLDSEKCNYWEAVLKNKENVIAKIPEEVTIVTWNSRHNKSVLEQQLEEINLKHTVLGKNSKWATNRVKLATLKEHTISTPYILGMDAYDVLIADDLSDIIDRFLKKNVELLYNASTWIYPDSKTHETKAKELCNKPPFQFLNGGLFIGKTEFVKNMLDTLPDPKEYKTSEQYVLQKMYHALFPKMQIDWNCEIFQIIHLPKRFGLKIEDFVEII